MAVFRGVDFESGAQTGHATGFGTQFPLHFRYISVTKLETRKHGSSLHFTQKCRLQNLVGAQTGHRHVRFGTLTPPLSGLGTGFRGPNRRGPNRTSPCPVWAPSPVACPVWDLRSFESRRCTSLFCPQLRDSPPFFVRNCRAPFLICRSKTQIFCEKIWEPTVAGLGA